MKKSGRRKYTDESRDEAVKLVTTQGVGKADGLLRRNYAVYYQHNPSKLIQD